MRFFPKGLDPFKIQTRFKFMFASEIIIQNTEIFGSWTKKKSCLILNYLPSCQIWRFLDFRGLGFVFSMLE
jgi:hypothetical protein